MVIDYKEQRSLTREQKEAVGLLGSLRVCVGSQKKV